MVTGTGGTCRGCDKQPVIDQILLQKIYMVKSPQFMGRLFTKLSLITNVLLVFGNVL